MAEPGQPDLRRAAGSPMRVLVLDVGCGTTDILLWDSSCTDENQTHLIIPSATRTVAAEIKQATSQGAPVVMEGALMGGGPNAAAMRAHVKQGLPFYATPSAARSFDDDLRVVRDMGVTLVDPGQVPALAEKGAAVVHSGDVRFEALSKALSLLGESQELTGCALAVQDHGQAPAGESDRVCRFAHMAATLSESRHLSVFFHKRGDIPAYFTRMQAAAGLIPRELPLVVGDTGPAALWGAALAASRFPCLSINFGNSHTLMAFVDGENLDGLFEHHTGMLTPEKMEQYVQRFAAGKLEMSEVYQDGGHGTLPVSHPYSLAEAEIVATGPRRDEFADIGLPLVEASLHGDMMLTGCYGLLQGYLANVGGERVLP